MSFDATCAAENSFVVTVIFEPVTAGDWERFYGVRDITSAYLIEDPDTPCLVTFVYAADTSAARTKLSEIFDAHRLSPTAWEFATCTIE
jgi:hypothetical protein